MSRRPHPVAVAAIGHNSQAAEPRHEFSQLDDQVMLRIPEAADVLGMSKHTLKSWASRGEGPRIIKFGRASRISVGDLRSFIAAQRKAP